CLDIFFPPVWQSIYCGCNPPPAPSGGTHESTQTQITWNWNSVAGADGYKSNTVNDYSGAADHGTNLSRLQSGLSCDSPYTLYVWAYTHVCGPSEPLVLTHSTD